MVDFSRARTKCQDLLSEQKVLVSHEANGGGQVCTLYVYTVKKVTKLSQDGNN